VRCNRRDAPVSLTIFKESAIETEAALLKTGRIT
jgi:hypothetical protein